MTAMTLTPVLTADRTAVPDSHFTRMLNPLPGFVLAHSGIQPVYREATEYAAAAFRRAYGADLNQFMPWLLTLQCFGKVSGLAGLRPAMSHGQDCPLFLEHYLDEPIDARLSAVTGEDVARSTVVEIGNVAASQRGASQLVFLLLTSTLKAAGYEWIVFTATRTLRHTLERLDFPLLDLGEASRDCLPADQQDAWGTYYDTAPRVMAGRLDSLDALVARRPLLRQALHVYEGAITDMIDTLRGE